MAGRGGAPPPLRQASGAGGSCCGFGAEVALCAPRLAGSRRAAASRRQWLQPSVLPSDPAAPSLLRRSVPTSSPA